MNTTNNTTNTTNNKTSNINNNNNTTTSNKRKQPDAIEVFNFELDFELENFYQEIEDFYEGNAEE